MTLNELNTLVKNFVNEYIVTNIQEQLGASGGNATDGNDITSPRPFPDDKSEIKNYINKNVYGAEGGQRRGMDSAFGPNYNNGAKRGMMEIKNYIKNSLKEQAYGHATLTTQGPSRTRTRVPTDEYPFSALPKRTGSGYRENKINEQEMEYTRDNTFTYNESWLKDKLGNPVKDVYEFNNDNGHMTIYPDLGNSKYKDRSSQFIRFELKDGEIVI